MSREGISGCTWELASSKPLLSRRKLRASNACIPLDLSLCPLLALLITRRISAVAMDDAMAAAMTIPAKTPEAVPVACAGDRELEVNDAI